MLHRTALDSGWLIRADRLGPDAPAHLQDLTIPTTLPSDVLSELIRTEVAPDPRIGANEAAIAWVGRSDWTYSTSVQLGADCVDREVDLVLLGVDTVADVRIDGASVLTTENMHRRYRVPLGRADHERRVDVEVSLKDAWAHAEHVMAELGPRPNVYPSPANFLRKAAYNFGWDWGPTVVTAGLWRPVLLESWAVARLDHVRPVADWDGRRGTFSVTGVIVRDSTTPTNVLVEVEVAGTTVGLDVGATESSFSLTLTDLPVDPWSPRGHGDQALYAVSVRLWAGPDLLDEVHTRTGFRRAELRTSDALGGEGFEIVVNGSVVQVRGVNWIPEDCFPARLTRSRYAARLDDALDAGCNLVRVWGGGIYEDDAFYDLCDERGLLVWQDFPFACAAYPEEEPFRTEVTAEATDNVERLIAHPSLVLWNGNNEVIEGFQSWGWQEPLAGRTWGWGFFTDTLPRVVAQVDGSRPYWPGSPYAGTLERPVNEPTHGTNHIWDVWNREDYLAYRDHRPRFAAEFGFQGPACWRTLRDAVQPEHLDVASPVFQAHQKAIDGQLKLDRSLAEHFGVPADFGNWHYLAQLNQARALTVGIEHLRSLTPWCSGTVWWQLNDCWPAMSWSVVDSAGRRKPAWFALRRAYAARLLTIQPRATGLAATLLNDTNESMSTHLAVELRSLDGAVLAHEQVPMQVAARGASTVDLPDHLVAPAGDPDTFLVAQVESGVPGAERALWFFAPDRLLTLDRSALRVEVDRHGAGVDLRLTATGLVRDIWIRADVIDPEATVSDQLITLLPGEEAVVRVATAMPEHLGWGSPAVVVSVNSLGLEESSPGPASATAAAVTSKGPNG